MKFLKYIPYLVILILASCNVTKDIVKTKTDTETSTVTKTETDRTITEKIDTTIVIKADTLKGFSENLETDPIVLEDENLILTVTKDKRGTHAKTVKKPQQIRVFKDKSTIEHIDASEETQSETFTKTKEKQIERTGGFNFNYLWWLLLLILIPIWRFRKVLF